MDQLGNTWIYYVPTAIDRPLKEFKHRLGLILRAGESGSEEKALEVHEAYDSAELDLLYPEETREQLSWP